MANIAFPGLTGPRPTPRDVWSWVARGDVGLALGVVGIIVLLILPIPSFGPKILLGSQLAFELSLVGQRVVPAVLESAGFTWDFPALDGALAHVLG